VQSGSQPAVAFVATIGTLLLPLGAVLLFVPGTTSRITMMIFLTGCALLVAGGLLIATAVRWSRL
jgi:uncharacterized membrane protein HdeD (DUF308 family)